MQLDEKWSFVAKKEAHLEAGDPQRWGDAWDHTAVDPEHRLLLAVVPGKRTLENCQKVVQEVKRRTGGRTDMLLTSDEHAPYATAIEEAYHELVAVPRRPGPGRPANPKRVMPAGLCYGNCQVTVNCHYAERTIAWPVIVSADWEFLQPH